MFLEKGSTTSLMLIYKKYDPLKRLATGIFRLARMLTRFLFIHTLYSLSLQ